ncbi:hypothetical protein QQ045_026207 [Rhodiola kirilowii]
MAANMKRLLLVAVVLVVFLTLQSQLSSARLLSSDFKQIPTHKQPHNTELAAGQYAAPVVVSTLTKGVKVLPFGTRKGFEYSMLPKGVKIPPSGPSKRTNGLKN